MTQPSPEAGAPAQNRAPQFFGGPLLFGAPVREAQAVMVLVHGRGAGAQSMRPLADALARPGLAFVVPDAARVHGPSLGGSWYPYSFLAPIPDNQPYLDRALAMLDQLVQQLLAGLPAEKLLLAGFSQGACLAVEFAARHPRRYGGAAVFSGGLIGPPGTPRDYPGAFEGSPVFLGCSDVDPHIPAARVLETERVLSGMGAQVTARLYPNLPHTINDDELAFADGMIEAVLKA